MRSTRLGINSSTSPFSVVQGATGLTTKSTNSATMKSYVQCENGCESAIEISIHEIL